MAPNGIPVPPVPQPGTRPLAEQIQFHRRRLSNEEHVSPLWRSHENDEWWLAVFQARWDEDMRVTVGLNGPPTQRNIEGRDRW